MSGCLLTDSDHAFDASQRDFVQANVLDRGPDNRQATGLGCEDVNLIGALSHIAKETFDGVGRLHVTMHHLRKRIKCQEMLLVLSQTSYRFGIALSILGGSRQPSGSRPPAVSVAPKYPPVRLGHRRALVWG